MQYLKNGIYDALKNYSLLLENDFEVEVYYPNHVERAE